MKSDNLSLYELFHRERRHVVPLFQRPYVWNEAEQWAPLWHDILDRAQAALDRDKNRSRGKVGSHFLGAVVFNQADVFGKEIAAVDVIDGQQRLTTLQVLLAAFRDLAKELGEDRLARNLLRLTENEDVDLDERPHELHKVWPTNADRECFRAALTARSPENLEKLYPLVKRKYARKPDPRPPLIEAYLYFDGALREYLLARSAVDGESESEPKFDVDRADALFEAFKHHLQIVVIDLEEEDDPQVIFETLNARGVPLLPSDLIRNFIFLRASRLGEDADKLYKKWWAEYDEREPEDGADGNQKFWKQTERQGRLLRTRLDLFIHHYLSYRSGQDLEIGHLFKSFRSWWDLQPERNVDRELEVLRKHSDMFGELFVPSGNTRLDTFARRLRAIDTSTVYPLLLFLTVEGRNRVSDGDFEGILVDLESYLVRRMVCDSGSKNYNRFFRSLLTKLKESETITRDQVQCFLTEPVGPAAEWPDDRAFKRAWLEKPVYQTMKASKCAMVLLAIDEQMRSAKQEEISVSGPLTVEHVMPQGWEEHWPAPAALEGATELDEDAVDRRHRLVQAMGNLTLLTQSLNSTVSNGPYDAKRPEIAKQSALRLNTYFQDATDWNEEKIEKRAELLFERALSLWPRPGADR